MKTNFEWVAVQAGGCSLRTEIGEYMVYIFAGHWLSGKYRGRIWASLREGGDQRLICDVRGYKSLDHAKLACERHYKRRIKAIVAEAKTIGVMK